MAVEVGQSAPDFTLYDTDRNQRSLGEFKGKNVVLAFFPGAFTGVCTTEMCARRDQIDQFNSMNADGCDKIAVGVQQRSKAGAPAQGSRLTMLRAIRCEEDNSWLWK